MLLCEAQAHVLNYKPRIDKEYFRVLPGVIKWGEVQANGRTQKLHFTTCDCGGGTHGNHQFAAVRAVYCGVT